MVWGQPAALASGCTWLSRAEGHPQGFHPSPHLLSLHPPALREPQGSWARHEPLPEQPWAAAHGAASERGCFWMAHQGRALQRTSSLYGWDWPGVAAVPAPGIKRSGGSVVRRATLQALQQIKLVPLPITAPVDPSRPTHPVCGEWPSGGFGVGRKSLCRHFWKTFPMFWAGFGFSPSFPSHLELTSGDGYGLSSPTQRQAVLHSTLPRWQPWCLVSLSQASWRGSMSWNGSVPSAVPALTSMGFVSDSCQVVQGDQLPGGRHLAMMVLPLRGQPLGLHGPGPQRKAVISYGDCAQPIEVVEVACYWRQHGECRSQGGLIPQWAEKQSQMLMIQPEIKSLSAFFHPSAVQPTYKFLFKYH